MADENVSLEHHFTERLESLGKEYDRRFERIDEKVVELSKTPWTTITGVLIILFMIIGGYWILMDLRFVSIEERVKEVVVNLEKANAEFIRRNELLVTKEALVTEIRNMNKLVDKNTSDIIDINKELVRRRAEFVEQVELRALEKRIDNLIQELNRRISGKMSKESFDAWKNERDKLIADINKHLEHLTKLNQPK